MMDQQPSFLPAANESSYKVGEIFYVQKLVSIQEQKCYRLIGPMVMLEVDWVDRVALMLDLRCGQFIESPLHIISPPEKPLSAKHSRRLEEFFHGNSIQPLVTLSRRGSRLTPPDSHVQVFEVLRENMKFLRKDPNGYRVLTTNLWRSSIFGPLFGA